MLGAYSDWLLDQQRAADVIALVGNETRVDALLLRLALAQRAARRPEAAATIETLRARFDASRARGDAVHQRENARFELVVARRRAQRTARSRSTTGKCNASRRTCASSPKPRPPPAMLRRMGIVKRWLAADGTRISGGRLAGRRRPRSGRNEIAGVVTLAMLLLGASLAPAHAHKPSDSYLTLSVEGDDDRRASGTSRCAISISRSASTRNQDDAITWGEVRAKPRRYRGLCVVAAAARAAPTLPARRSVTGHLIDDHSDGAYAVLRFTATCVAAPEALAVGYRLFFDLDPQHRGLLRLEHGGKTRAGIFTADTPEQSFSLAEFSKWEQFVDYGKEGVWHIWTGFDHVLFLLSLLLPAVLVGTPLALRAVPPRGEFAPAGAFAPLAAGRRLPRFVHRCRESRNRVYARAFDHAVARRARRRQPAVALGRVGDRAVRRAGRPQQRVAGRSTASAG